MDEQELENSLELLETLNVMHDEKMAMMDKRTYIDVSRTRCHFPSTQGLF